jgi:hypothetical protein
LNRPRLGARVIKKREEMVVGRVWGVLVAAPRGVAHRVRAIVPEKQKDEKIEGLKNRRTIFLPEKQKDGSH